MLFPSDTLTPSPLPYIGHLTLVQAVHKSFKVKGTKLCFVTLYAQLLTICLPNLMYMYWFLFAVHLSLLTPAPYMYIFRGSRKNK